MSWLAALALTVLAIAYAGLAPLDFRPLNGASWLASGPGLRFASVALVYSDGPFSWSPGGPEFSIELWFEPAAQPRARVARLLAVQDGHEVPVLSIDQWRDALIVRDRITTESGRLVYREYALPDTLAPGRAHHLTLASDASGMRLYLDGQPTALETRTPVLAEGEQLAGQLLLGNAARGNQEWSGVLRGVAFTAGALAPEAIAQRTADSASELAAGPDLVALYPLDEGEGVAARDREARAPALHVPPGFQPLRRSVLRWPDPRDRSASWFLRDLLVNLVGFVPAGFFLGRVLRRRERRAAAVVLGATLLAGGLSLAIELTQVWLPSRVSSLTDLLSNVAGGALGGALALVTGRRRSALAAALAFLLVRPADARTLELPIPLDYPFLRQRIVEQLFTRPGEGAPPLHDTSRCNRIALSQPELSERDGRLWLRARFDARAGAGLGGRCYGSTQRQGLLDAALEPTLHPTLPILAFRVAESRLLDSDGRQRLAGQLWEWVRAQVKPQVETLTVDLTAPLAELKTFLPQLLSDEEVERWRPSIDALAIADASVEPTALVLRLQLELPEPRTPSPSAPETPLDAAELARWEAAWQSWDAFLTFLIRHGLRDADQTQRLALREVLIDARGDLEAILLAPELRGSDPVRPLFLETWSRLAPLLREIAAQRPGESALRYLSLIAAADAFAALDRLGPAYGVELSTDGLRRLARMLDPAPSVDPTAYGEAVDPELRELFGFGPPLELEPPGAATEDAPDAPPPVPEPSPRSRLDAPHRAAQRPAILRVVASGERSLDRWVPRHAELLDYLARVRDLLHATAAETRKRKELTPRHAALYRNLVLATAWQESCWRQVTRRAGQIQPLTSPVGAVGIMQVHQRVWRGFYDVGALRTSIRYNARAGSEILHHYLVDYALAKREHEVRGDPDDLARATYAAYNAGPRQLRRYRRAFGKATGHRIDHAFAEKYRRMQAGDELAVASCFPGYSA